jgi:hypothetical protein
LAVCSKRARNISATYLENELYSDRNTGLILEKRDGISLKYILGLINSTPYNIIHVNTHNSTYISFPSIEALPYIQASDKIVSEVENIVDTILVKKRESIKADTSKEEDTIDKIVYELFQMDEDTIKMVEEYK